MLLVPHPKSPWPASEISNNCGDSVGTFSAFCLTYLAS